MGLVIGQPDEAEVSPEAVSGLIGSEAVQCLLTKGQWLAAHNQLSLKQEITAGSIVIEPD